LRQSVQESQSCEVLNFWIGFLSQSASTEKDKKENKKQCPLNFDLPEPQKPQEDKTSLRFKFANRERGVSKNGSC